MKRDVAIGIGAGLIGGGLALLLGGVLSRDDERAPVMAPAAGGIFVLDPPRAPTPLRTCLTPVAAVESDGEERARRIRVLVYRVRCGELTLASPEVTSDVSSDVADIIEGVYCPPRPCGAAEGALPLSW
jgi:hypothetical protein